MAKPRVVQIVGGCEVVGLLSHGREVWWVDDVEIGVLGNRQVE